MCVFFVIVLNKLPLPNMSDLVNLCVEQLDGCMIVGIDTYHDSSQKGQSVGGFVASLNKRYTR